MGLFRISDGVIGRSMPLTGLVGAPNARPAWVFQNQTGDLGNFLDGSVLYVGVTGDISVIMPGVSLASVNSLSIVNAGTGYSTAVADLATTDANNLSQGLTVDITAAAVGGAIQTVTIKTAGSGYNVGDIVTIVEGGRPGGSIDATARVTAVNQGVPIALQAIEFKGVQAGTILPVAVDYVTSLTTVTEADIIVGR